MPSTPASDIPAVTTTFVDTTSPPHRKPVSVEYVVEQIIAILDQIDPAAGPSVVFAGLAQACVPDLATHCHFSIIEHSPSVYDICCPPGTDHTEDRAVHALSLAVDGIGNFPGYAVELQFHFPDAEQPELLRVVARLVTSHAQQLLDRYRLQCIADGHAGDVAHLRVALQTNREIGAAMGILMTAHKLTNSQAFDLLRRISQITHVKLRDVAADINLTGIIDLPRHHDLLHAATTAAMSSTA